MLTLPRAGMRIRMLERAAKMHGADVVRVRFHIIRNACIENVGKSQSCMVSKLPIIWKQTVICTREPDLVAVDVHWLVGLLHNVRLGNNNATRTTTPNLSNSFPRILLSCEQIILP